MTLKVLIPLYAALLWPIKWKNFRLRNFGYIPLYNNHFHRNNVSFATPLNESSLHISRPLSQLRAKKITTAECHGTSAVQLPLAKGCQIPDFNSMSGSKNHRKILEKYIQFTVWNNISTAKRWSCNTTTMAVKQMVFEGSGRFFLCVRPGLKNPHGLLMFSGSHFATTDGIGQMMKSFQLGTWKYVYIYTRSTYTGKVPWQFAGVSMNNPATLPMGDKKASNYTKMERKHVFIHKYYIYIIIYNIICIYNYI